MSHRAEGMKISVAYKSHGSYTYSYLAMCKNEKCSLKQSYCKQTKKAQEDLRAVYSHDCSGKTGNLVLATKLWEDSKFDMMFS